MLERKANEIIKNKNEEKVLVHLSVRYLQNSPRHIESFRSDLFYMYFDVRTICYENITFS